MATFLDPAILFFTVGIIAGCAKSNLEIPAPISRFLAMYHAIGTCAPRKPTASSVSGIFVLPAPLRDCASVTATAAKG